MIKWVADVKYGKGVFPLFFVSTIATCCDQATTAQKLKNAFTLYARQMIDVTGVLPYNTLVIPQSPGSVCTEETH